MRGEPAPTHYEIEILTKDGQVRWIELSADLIKFEGKPTVVGTAFDVTERKLCQIQQERVLAAEREQRQLAETLGEIFLTLTAQTSRKAVLDEILRQTQQVVPHSAANIVLLDDNVLRPVRWNGYEIFGSEEYVIDLEQSLADYPLDEKVIQTCQPLVVPNTQQDPRWVTVAESAWIRSHLSVPISLHNQVLGLLRLDGDIPNQFSPKDAKRLQPLASAAAIALENARFYDQTRQDRVERIIQPETEIIQLDQKLQTLQHASSAITSSLDFQSVLETTLDLGRGIKCDCSSVHMGLPPIELFS